MLQDIASIVFVLVQIVAGLWVVGLILSVLLGYGISENGRVAVRNRRGRFLALRICEVQDFFGAIVQRLKGKTHESKMGATDMRGNPLPSEKEETQTKS